MSTRETLLRTALQVFAERGTDGGSMREIARRSGVNVATAYHHFGSKRELLLAIFRELGFIDVPEDQMPQMPVPDDPKQALEWLFLGSWALLTNGADVIRLAITEGMKGDTEVLEFFEEWQRQGDARIEYELLRYGIATHLNAAERAWTVRQIIWGAFVAALIGGPMDIETFAAHARTAADGLIESWR